MLKIGIILREYKEFLKIDKDIISYLKPYNISYIGIVSGNLKYTKDIIDLCDGIIFPGGNIVGHYDIEILKYLRKIDKPTLGICLGMQEMAMISGTTVKIENNNHNSNMDYVHEIKLLDSTKLKEILKKDSILVNSRHIYKVNNTTLNISSYSTDNIIESIEDNSKLFFIGVQWHPEDLRNDINSKLLVENFIKSCYNMHWKQRR